jgi:hypothetical protein
MLFLGLIKLTFLYGVVYFLVLTPIALIRRKRMDKLDESAASYLKTSENFRVHFDRPY